MATERGDQTCSGNLLESAFDGALEHDDEMVLVEAGRPADTTCSLERWAGAGPRRRRTRPRRRPMARASGQR
jgi:hypothetical protein